MRRRQVKSGVKDPGSTRDEGWKLTILSTAEEEGITGVGVKSVETGKKASGEGAFLGCY